MPENRSSQGSGSSQQNRAPQLSEEQKRELARMLIEMLKQELQVERDRFGRNL